jgi:hypothetical protein
VGSGPETIVPQEVGRRGIPFLGVREAKQCVPELVMRPNRFAVSRNDLPLGIIFLVEV